VILSKGAREEEHINHIRGERRERREETVNAAIGFTLTRKALEGILEELFLLRLARDDRSLMSAERKDQCLQCFYIGKGSGSTLIHGLLDSTKHTSGDPKPSRALVGA